MLIQTGNGTADCPLGTQVLSHGYCPLHGYCVADALLYPDYSDRSCPEHRRTLSPLFYFPILYATYFYPRRGIILAGLCGIVYECLVYFSLFPDTLALWSATGQAVLFVCVALAVVYFTNIIRVSEARYRSIFENSLLGVILFDKNTFTIRLANQQVAAMLGYTVEELSGTTFSRLFFSHDFQRLFFEHLGSGEDIRNFETCFATKTKEPHWVNLSWSRIDDTVVSCSVIDTNTEKLVRQEAVDSSTQYRQVTENSPTGMVITDHTKILFANPAFSIFSGTHRTNAQAGILLTVSLMRTRNAL